MPHAPRDRTNEPHGTYARYKSGCRCEPCVETYREYHRNYRRTRTVGYMPIRRLNAYERIRRAAALLLTSDTSEHRTLLRSAIQLYTDQFEPDQPTGEARLAG